MLAAWNNGAVLFDGHALAFQRKIAQKIRDRRVRPAHDVRSTIDDDGKHGSAGNMAGERSF